MAVFAETGVRGSDAIHVTDAACTSSMTPSESSTVERDTLSGLRKVISSSNMRCQRLASSHMSIMIDHEPLSISPAQYGLSQLGVYVRCSISALKTHSTTATSTSAIPRGLIVLRSASAFFFSPPAASATSCGRSPTTPPARSRRGLIFLYTAIARAMHSWTLSGSVSTDGGGERFSRRLMPVDFWTSSVQPEKGDSSSLTGPAGHESMLSEKGRPTALLNASITPLGSSSRSSASMIAHLAPVWSM
mmetsp:Transcript_47169/g.139138  ORF Transcript_47169/g.139138 Transcript_47169/m.139138 type:complete len:247 (-) Transcript_47169:395-1135(-)